MAKPMSENSRIVLKYMQENADKDIIAKDIAEATGLGARTVNGCITAFQKKGFMQRVPATMTTEDGEETVKLIRITEAGRTFDPDAKPEEDEEDE